MRISVFAEKCTGFKICELVCSHTKLRVFSPESARINVVNLRLHDVSLSFGKLKALREIEKSYREVKHYTRRKRWLG